MKMLICLNMIMFMLGGCSTKQNYVELTEGTFQNLEVSEILSVNIMSTLTGKKPDEWVPIDVYLFPITDSEKIKVIYDCIDNAAEFNPSNTDYDGRKLLFTTKETICYLDTWLTKEFAFGDWWKSEKLCSLFGEWRPKLLIYDYSNNKQVKMVEHLSNDPNSTLFKLNDPNYPGMMGETKGGN